jgi:hypothetical protein
VCSFLLFWLHAQIYDVMAVASGHIEADGPKTIDNSGGCYAYACMQEQQQNSVGLIHGKHI